MMVSIGGLQILNDDGSERCKIPSVEYSRMEEQHVLAVEKSYLGFLASLLECGIASAQAKGQVDDSVAAYLRQPINFGGSSE